MEKIQYYAKEFLSGEDSYWGAEVIETGNFSLPGYT